MTATPLLLVIGFILVLAIIATWAAVNRAETTLNREEKLAAAQETARAEAAARERRR
jgi:hypothetical protein